MLPGLWCAVEFDTALICSQLYVKVISQNDCDVTVWQLVKMKYIENGIKVELHSIHLQNFALCTMRRLWDISTINNYLWTFYSFNAFAKWQSKASGYLKIVNIGWLSVKISYCFAGLAWKMPDIQGIGWVRKADGQTHAANCTQAVWGLTQHCFPLINPPAATH